MNIDMNYFLTRLQNGEDIDVIGKDIAKMMNEALDEHNKILEEEKRAKALAEQELAKRELIEELVGIIKELAILEGMDGADLALSDQEMDELVKSFSAMFTMVRKMHEFAATPVTVTDDQILGEFAKRLK